jgi:multimeric flavodoxin WrbA
MSKSGIIIQGSSRATGNTRRIVDFVNRGPGFEVVELVTKDIGHFDYDFRNSNDDFLPLMRHIVAAHQTIVFATPVYWYSMSGLMKVFFDRISDLLKTEKDLGRALRGLNMAMISCGSDAERAAGYEVPFVESAAYLGMNYLGDIHSWIDDDGDIPASLQTKLNAFAEKLKSKSANRITVSKR